MKTIVPLKSGHKLTVNLASLAEADELLNRVTAACRSVKLEISPGVILALMNSDKKAALGALLGEDANTAWNLGLELLGNRAVKEQVWNCARVCMLNAKGLDESIVFPGSFEPREARPDMIPVALEVMKANLAPFFESLESASKTRGESKEQSQK